MPNYQPMFEFCSDEQTRELFSNSFFSKLFDKYGAKPQSFNDVDFVQSRVQAQLATMVHVFDSDKTLPRTVLDIGCGSETGGDVFWSPHFRFKDYHPWFGRALHHVSDKPAFSRYHLDRFVGVDIGDAEEAFEFHMLDLFGPAALEEIVGKFGMINSSYFFSSPVLSRQVYGDSRGDTGVREHMLPLMDKLAPALDKKLVRGKDGLVFYSL